MVEATAELYVLEIVSHSSPYKEGCFLRVCHICKANSLTKARRQECYNSNMLEWVWLLRKQEYNIPCAVRQALYSSSITNKTKQTKKTCAFHYSLKV